jgi:hypothetical protein
MNDLMAMKSEVKQLSNLLQQLQSFLKSLTVHQQQQPGGGGSGGGSGPGGSGAGGPANQGGIPGQGISHSTQGVAGQGASRHGQQQLSHDEKSYHQTSSVPSQESFRYVIPINYLMQ